MRMIENSIGIPYCIKSPTGQDPKAAERQMSLKRPAAGGESCKQDSFYYLNIYPIESLQPIKIF